MAIHAGDDEEPDTEVFRERLFEHRRNIHQSLQLITSSFLDAAVVPIDARSYFDWLQSSEQDRNLLSINNYIHHVAKTSAADIMHFGGYPLPRFAIAGNPGDHFGLVALPDRHSHLEPLTPFWRAL